MKSQTDAYIERETRSEQRAVELFHIWRADGSEHWRLTSHDEAVSYQGNSFSPASVNRGAVQYDSKLEVSTMTVVAVFEQDPIIDFIAQNPIEVLWVEVLRVHKDLADQASVVFIGQGKVTTLRGQEATLDCVGFEFHLRLRIPTLRYQPKCNWFVYDSIVDGAGCGVDKTGYKVTTTVSVSEDQLTLESSDFSSYDDGYFKYGWIEYGGERRMITFHEGDEIRIRYKIFDLTGSKQIDAYPGCDGEPETCRDKFNNVNQRMAFDFIPVDNPALKY